MRQNRFDIQTDSGTPAPRRVARAAPVFAAEQVDGIMIPASPLPQPVHPVLVHEAADAFVAATAAQILHAGHRAFYRPADDTNTLPPRETCVGSPTSTPTEAEDRYYAMLDEQKLAA
jgi:antirestriction protein ArdC